MDVVVNGERQEVPPDQSVSSLLKWLQIPSDRVAVELNKRLVRKRDWDQTVVPHASQVEIVEFVGGG
ncbi:MAG: sulfur carrier protein ThiS [Acidobacteriaceae bacterium]|nr:sulfur carrier protein ThiS [Acidobacteriaceae bacterium]MBV9034212.1 sulfur carrier protein ThiS [Acidobacteriaceae bacterium]MBV9226815.1 sulfur carrier protein ThiS [Acidobacteriaceae bacterium]MBV9305039.1 sulfur carrier protein ThiS [Acidobacteriaceae bacterium]MBV9678697.1 sulfur carrier protein ThiS [Acidobacteriaceae bacterium]